MLKIDESKMLVAVVIQRAAETFPGFDKSKILVAVVIQRAAKTFPANSLLAGALCALRARFAEKRMAVRLSKFTYSARALCLTRTLC